MLCGVSTVRPIMALRYRQHLASSQDQLANCLFRFESYLEEPKINSLAGEIKFFLCSGEPRGAGHYDP
jgi:hypothetical protein